MAMYLEFKMTVDRATSPLPTALAGADAALKLWSVLTRTQNAVARCVRTAVEPHGISPTEFAVLEVLYTGGPLPIGEVGARVLLTSGSMTYVADKLVERGLLARRPCGEDQRVIYAGLTDAGRTLMDEVYPRYAGVVARAFGDLDESDQRAATELLRRIGRCAGGMCER
jgi:MarR family 2-MHQ and catechol resistance regulon transcriptional repressor